jgi:hypothetical protein
MGSESTEFQILRIIQYELSSIPLIRDESKVDSVLRGFGMKRA